MRKSPEAKAKQAEYLRAYRKTYRTQRKRVNVTFTLEEFAQLERSAQEAGETVTGFVHRMSVEALSGHRTLSKGDEERFSAFVRIIRGIANNLNQMARHSNTVRSVLDEREIGYQLEYLESATRELLARGGAPPS